MSYRPKDFKNPYEYEKKVEGEYQLPSVIFEAGADAMLEGLWGMAKESPTGEFSFDSNFHRA